LADNRIPLVALLTLVLRLAGRVARGPIREAPLAQRGTSPVPSGNLGGGRGDPSPTLLFTTQRDFDGCSSRWLLSDALQRPPFNPAPDL